MSQLNGLRLRRRAIVRNLSVRIVRRNHGRDSNSTRSLHRTSGKRKSLWKKSPKRTRSRS